MFKLYETTFCLKRRRLVQEPTDKIVLKIGLKTLYWRFARRTSYKSDLRWEVSGIVNLKLQINK